MNKTTSISIDNKKFDLEEEANEILNKYFTSVQNYFSSHANHEEILIDIENSIAEKFMEKLGKNKEVIVKKDVEDVIKSMGTVEDFEQFEEQNETISKKENLTEQKQAKKLYRDKDNKVLGGVALGLATYFNIDVSLVRLLFVFAALFRGSGVLIYLILWVIVPEAKTTQQKIEMYGGSSALASIEKKITVQSIEEKNETQNRIRRAIGIFLMVISGIAMGAGFLFLIFFHHLPSFFIGFFIIIYGLFILPFIVLMCLGRNLANNKNVSKTSIVFLILLSMFVLFALRIITFRIY